MFVKNVTLLFLLEKVPLSIVITVRKMKKEINNYKNKEK